MIKKRVLIFGASGQIGRYCIRRLVKDNYKVTAITRNKHQKAYILKTQAPIGYLDIEETDIFDIQKITKFISETDVCINLPPNLLSSRFIIEKVFPEIYLRRFKLLL